MILTGQNYEFLLKLADEYQIDKVRKLCAKFLHYNVSYDTSLEFFNVSFSYGLEEVKQISLTMTSMLTVDSLTSSQAYSDTSDEAKVIIVLTARIQKLEDLLKKYSSTCTKVVDVIYNAVQNKLHPGASSYECEVKNIHENIENYIGIPYKKQFDSHCYRCTAQAEKKWSTKCTGHLRSLKDSITNMRHLNANCKNLNISTVNDEDEDYSSD